MSPVHPTHDPVPAERSPHPPPDLPLVLPPGWRRAGRPGAGILLSATPPQPGPSGVRPGINLVAAPVTCTLDDWVEQTLRDLAADLAHLELEDEDDYDDGCPVTYRRFSYAHQGHDLLCDLWAWVSDGTGVMLTGTVAREDYLDYCDLFEAVAVGCDPQAVVAALSDARPRSRPQAS